MVTLKLDCGHERTQWSGHPIPKECWCNKCGQVRKVVTPEPVEK